MKMKQSQISHVQRDSDRDINIKPIDFSVFSRIFSYSKPYKAKRSILIALVLTRAVQLPVLTWIIGIIINGPIEHGNMAGIWWGVGGFLLFAAFIQISFYFRQKLALELGESVIHDLRRDMLEHIIYMPMGFFTKTRLGRIISRFTSDSEAVRTGIQNVVFVSTVQFGNMVIASILMVYYDWKLFIVVASMGPAIWLINRHFRLRLLHAYREVQESFSRVSATVVESIRGIRIIQGYSREKFNAELFRDLAMDHSNYNLKVARTEAVFLPLLEMNSQFVLSALIIIGGYRVLSPDSGITIGTMIQFLFLSNFFFSPIQTLAGQYNQALTAMAGAERVFSFIDQEPDWKEKEDVQDVGDLKGRVEFKNVSFSYNPGKEILKNINFGADPGQTIALVGSTGSGKTTVTNLIAKFYPPDSGEILVDGRNILDIKAESLRKHLGIVLQMNFLFSGTVYENILVGRTGATEKEAVEAVLKLDCLDVIENLPEGFNTKVGENGIGLSMGQRQLICFSRAMLADPKIFILDEATSSVDSLTELKLQNALAKLLANRTSFVVAHRLSTIKNANMVLVMDDGRIAERGTHSELIGLGGIYAGLYREFSLAEKI